MVHWTTNRFMLDVNESQLTLSTPTWISFRYPIVSINRRIINVLDCVRFNWDSIGRLILFYSLFLAQNKYAGWKSRPNINLGVAFSALYKCVLAAKQAACSLSAHSMSQSARNLSILPFEIRIHKNFLNQYHRKNIITSSRLYYALPQDRCSLGGRPQLICRELLNFYDITRIPTGIIR